MGERTNEGDPLVAVFGKDVAGLINAWRFRLTIADVCREYHRRCITKEGEEVAFEYGVRTLDYTRIQYFYWNYRDTDGEWDFIYQWNGNRTYRLPATYWTIKELY